MRIGHELCQRVEGGSMYRGSFIKARIAQSTTIKEGDSVREVSGEERSFLGWQEEWGEYVSSNR